jgi:hypothetical protein
MRLKASVENSPIAPMTIRAPAYPGVPENVREVEDG